MSQAAGVVVPEDVRQGLLDLHGGSQTRTFARLKPPFSTSTCYRAITGKPVGEDVKSWFSARYWGLTMRVVSDEDLNAALEAARVFLREERGRKIHMDDLKREIGLMIRQEEQGD